ncbi:MAG: hypothetical protein [Treponematales bacterium]
MHRDDWLPRREADLVLLQARWKEILSDPVKQQAYGWPAADCAAVTTKIDAFTDAREAYNEDNSRDNRIDKDMARDESMDEMRDFANGHIRYNKPMSVSEKDYLGIKPHNPPTPHPKPVSQPDTDVRNTRNHFEQEVRALNAEGSAVKPDDAYGVAFAWQVGGERPATGADLPKGEFSRKPVKVVQHTEADKGKTAYYATAYENSKGEKGPWSPVVEAVIA